MPVNVNPIIASIIDAAETLNTAPDDYINPDDGLKYCGKCHTPKEAYFPEQYHKNGLDKHPVTCKCAVEERARSGTPASAGSVCLMWSISGC